jgi:hypothetical protein
MYFLKFQQMVAQDRNANLTSHMLLLGLQDADTCISLQPREGGGYLGKISILRGISEVSQAKAICEEGLRRVPHSTDLARVAAAMADERDYDEGEELKKMLEVGIRDQCTVDRSHTSHSHSHSHPAGCACPEHIYVHNKEKAKEKAECMHCGGSPTKLLLCSACKTVSYCGN